MSRTIRTSATESHVPSWIDDRWPGSGRGVPERDRRLRIVAELREAGQEQPAPQQRGVEPAVGAGPPQAAWAAAEGDGQRAAGRDPEPAAQLAPPRRPPPAGHAGPL